MFCNEALSEINEGLQPDQYLQLKKCMVCRLNEGLQLDQSHEDWFRELRKPEQPGYVETGDDTIHPIQHVGNVPFDEEGNQTYIKNVLHVPTITKNLDSVDHIVDQGMQVRFNDGGCFIEKEGCIIARG